MDIYKYDSFSAKISPGAKVHIYVRPKWLVALGMGHRNDIFQMAIDGNIIFDISQTKKSSRQIILMALFAVPLFIALGKYISKKK